MIPCLPLCLPHFPQSGDLARNHHRRLAFLTEPLQVFQKQRQTAAIARSWFKSPRQGCVFIRVGIPQIDPLVHAQIILNLRKGQVRHGIIRSQGAFLQAVPTQLDRLFLNFIGYSLQ